MKSQNVHLPGSQSGTRTSRTPKRFARNAFAVILLLLCPPALHAADPYLGWMPVQFVAPGSETTIDMRRFFEPGDNGRLTLPGKTDGACRATIDSDGLTLRLALTPDARGFFAIPLRLVGKDGTTLREGLLTVAAADPGSADAGPRVFAEKQSANELVFHVVGGRAPSGVSAVVQFADGSSTPVAYESVGDKVVVPTARIPQGSWVRVAAADASGRPGLPARARVGVAPGFQWQDGILYYAFTDRFANGERANDRPVPDPKVAPQANYMGGDFQGIQKRIEAGYFKDLGVNVLWLAPLNRNPDGAWVEYLPPYRSYSGYHGYWPVSHTEVEPRFGGVDGLKNLVASAKDDGIKIIADLVLRHTHAEHPLWKEHPDWFGELTLPDGRKNLRLWDEQQFTTWFEEWLPGLDFDDPKAVSFLLDNAEYWAETFRLDGYRLDAVKHIQPSFWWKFRTTMRGVEKSLHSGPMYFVGETFMDRAGIMQFVGPNMLDGQFDFPLYDTIMEVFAMEKNGFDELEKSLAASETIYGKETLMSPLVGNHDKSRFMAFADGDLPDPEIADEEELGWAKPPAVDRPDSYKKLQLALAFILSIDGVPMIYYGDEVGLTGAGDPDNRRMMPEDSSLNPAQTGVRDFFSRAARFRLAHPALRYGSRRPLVADANRYAFVRRHLDDRVLCVWNRSAEPATFELDVAPELPDGKYSDAFSEKSLTAKAGRATLELPPRSVAFFAAEH